jgi:excisionase family DNA binding protein
MSETNIEPAPLERLLTIDEVGAVLGCKRAKVYTIISSCGLPAVKLLGSTRVRESDLRTFSANLRKAVLKEQPGYAFVRHSVAEAAAQ